MSWIPYNDRGDFVQDVAVVQTIVEENVGGKDPSFFNIPAQRHFKLAVDTSLYDRSGGPSFENSLNQAAQSLIQKIESGADSSDPFLAVVIGSHGGHGFLGTQDRGSFDLQPVVDLILRTGEKFHARTGKKLRLEILYAACHSGSLLPSLQKRRSFFKDKIGPITALTSTTSDKLSYGNLHEGDILLKWITQLIPKLGAARSQKDWGRVGPTLGQLGFFVHFGGSSSNHPQYLSSHFNWSERDTYNFLLVPNPRDTRTIGGAEIDNYFHRDLKIDIYKLAAETKNMRQALDLIGYENWNEALARDPDRLEKYLKHSQDFVRYAAALFILNPFEFKSRGVSKYEKFKATAEALVADWIRSPQFVASVKDFPNPDFFLTDYLRTANTKILGVTEVVQVLKAVHENFDGLLSGRAMMDFARRFLMEKYGVQEFKQTQLYARDGSRQYIRIPENLPLEFHALVNRAFHGVNRTVPDSDLVADILDVSKLNRSGRRLHPVRVLPQVGKDLSCDRVIGSRVSRRQLEFLTADSITRYDTSEYVNRYRGPDYVF